MAPALQRTADRSLGRSVIDWAADRRHDHPVPSYASLADELDRDHGIILHPETLRRWCATVDRMEAS